MNSKELEPPMKCCGSPMIFAAANTNERARVQDAMQAIVFAEILKPLTPALGPLGDVLTGAIAQRLFVRPR